MLPGPLEVCSGQPAGLQSGDIVVEYNGKAVKFAHEFAPWWRLRPGTEANLRVFREGAYKDLTIRIGRLEDASSATARGAREVARDWESRRKI